MWRRLILVALCLALLPVFPGVAQTQGMAASVYQTVNIRSGPDTRFEIVAQVGPGDTVQVTGRDSETGRWLRVALDDGLAGWIPSFLLVLEDDPALLPVVNGEPNDDTASQEVRVIAYGQVNIRSGPGIANNIVGQLDARDEAVAVARSNPRSDWLYVENEELAGWVAYFTVYVQGDPNLLPVRVPDPSGMGLVAPATLAFTRFNVRLREAPSVEAPVIGTVPYNSSVTPVARTSDGQWVYIAYATMVGWAVSDLLMLSEDEIASLPLYVSGDEYGEPDVFSPLDEVVRPLLPDVEVTPEATEAPE